MTIPFRSILLLVILVSSVGCGLRGAGLRDASNDASSDVQDTIVYHAACSPVPGACNFVDGTGCSSTEFCALRPSDGGFVAACVTGTAGTGVVGDACTRDECLPSLACVNGQCVKLCCPNSNDDCRNGPASDPRAFCVFPAPSDLPPGIRICGIPCDWARPTDCLENQMCLWTQSGTASAFCYPGGSQGLRDFCSVVNPSPSTSCSRGFYCLDAGDGGFCVLTCTIGGPECTGCAMPRGVPAGNGVCPP